ncbi:hypothetical protein RYX36_010850 [Vicia faba]
MNEERLYISYTCPFAQRVWITRNYKGLEDKIDLVPIDLQNRPAWYKENVYPENKVPSLEHNGEVLGESLDLVKYVDANFEGTPLSPNTNEESENLQQQLLNKEIDLASFLQKYKKLQTTYHKRTLIYLDAKTSKVRALI